MKGRIGDAARLKHILDAIIEIESYLLKSEFTDFMNNSMMRFACIKQLEIVGEASNHVSDETKQKFADIEWARITGMRNILVHEYFGVDEALVWDIPEPKVSLTAVLEALKHQP
tara:strand:+ start:220 stop:561 length:342 start_codon:yes stop_codon:yes gene_type:complete